MENVGMNNTHSFTSLFHEPVSRRDGKETITLNKIRIPGIQRPYAQGRPNKESTKVREAFLDEIFSHLRCDDKRMNLDFVYGKVEKLEQEWTMDLLDGQQRLTTLFLLYWYLLHRGEIPPENEEKVVKAIASFSYHTRTTSDHFCNLLAHGTQRLQFGGNPDVSPKKAIRNLMDYVMDYDEDPTVDAMLRMLDAIHEKFGIVFPDGGKGALFKRLENIQFRVLSLLDFKLSEELYIKMNARGLPLTPFECFKAEFLGLMDLDDRTERLVSLETGEDESNGVSFKQYFGTKLDTVWCDLFWNSTAPEQYDRSYMKFFARFFAARFLLDHQTDIHNKQWQKDKSLDLLVFHGSNGYEKDEKHYHGILPFQKMVKQFVSKVAYFDDIANFLRTLSGLRREQRYDEFLGSIKPLWESDDSKPDWFCDGTSQFEQMPLVKFAAIVEFFRLFPAFRIDVFSIWMKCVNCVVENTNIDNYTPAANTAGNLATLLHATAENLAENNSVSPIDFIKAMARVPETAVKTAAIRDEVEKAKRIAGSTEEEACRWTQAFDQIAIHPFLKGMIGFFYSPDMTIDEFATHAKLIGSLFGTDGISTPYKKDERHCMIRAIMSQLTHVKNVKKVYLVENSHEKYLKNLISSVSDSELHARMNDLFAKRLKGCVPGTENQTSEDVLAAFLSAIKDAPEIPESERWDFRETIRVLRNDEMFYRWVFDKKEDVKICWDDNQYQARADYQRSGGVLISVFRKAEAFAKATGMTPVAATTPHDVGFVAEYNMFVGETCAMRKPMDNRPDIAAEVRFLADERSYPVELWVSWEKDSLSSDEENRVLYQLLERIKEASIETLDFSRRGIRINTWTFSETSAANCITNIELMEQVNNLVKTPI